MVGARTEHLRSEPLFAGLVVTGAPLTLEEGGPVAQLVVTATVPVLCSPQDRATGECCVHLQLGLGPAGGEQRCPWGEPLHRVGLPSCATTTASTALWRDYRLPLHQVRVVPGTRRERCLSTASLSTFSGASVPLRPGTFTLYRHASGGQEVQVSYRRCNLRALCHCSVAVRIQDIVIAFDICSRGYLQVWSPSAAGATSARLPAGARLLSMDEGRAYRLLLPSGTVVSLGPLLSTVEVEASAGDLGATEGLCGAFGRQPRALGSQPGEWR